MFKLPLKPAEPVNGNPVPTPPPPPAPALSANDAVSA